MSWNKTDPSGTEKVKYLDERLREAKAALQTAFQSYGHFPIDADNPSYHYHGEFGAKAEAPSAGSSGIWFDTTDYDLYFDNGTSWVKCGSAWAADTKTLFYQNAAPVGWSIDVTSHANRLVLTDATGGDHTGSWTTTLGQWTTVHSHSHRTAKWDSVLSTDIGFICHTDETGYTSELTTTKTSNPGSASGAMSLYMGGAYSTSGVSEGGYTRTEDASHIHSHGGTHTQANHLVAKVLVCNKL